LVGECGTAVAGGETRRGAVCDGGSLLLARIEERFEDGMGPCAGSRDALSDAFVAFDARTQACVEVTFCNEVLGGGAALRVAEVCQIGAASGVGPGTLVTDCEMAVNEGTDGGPCSGTFGCFADRTIAPGDVLPVLAWCDAGLLRLAPSQTLIFGEP